VVKVFFQQVMEHEYLTLPDPKRPDQVKMVDNPLYCPYHRYIGHVIEDCVTFKEWLQRAIDEKRLAIPPDAVNPDFHAVNIITTRTNAAEANDDSWVPLAHVEHRLKSLELSQKIDERDPNDWQTVTHHKLTPRRITSM